MKTRKKVLLVILLIAVLNAAFLVNWVVDTVPVSVKQESFPLWSSVINLVAFAYLIITELFRMH